MNKADHDIVEDKQSLSLHVCLCLWLFIQGSSLCKIIPCFHSDYDLSLCSEYQETRIYLLRLSVINRHAHIHMAVHTYHGAGGSALKSTCIRNPVQPISDEKNVEWDVIGSPFTGGCTGGL